MKDQWLTNIKKIPISLVMREMLVKIYDLKK